ncbi:sphingosine kinase [Duganella sp. Leaf126]|uniref:diacylglycerol/lipid kinase family protein n=1 Tax=Duganella sp. Leaf126 TaxID=1736266 RepID=UPI0006F623CE|nr:diacylglycerol kinase family protein [Duganella sp. Leaf126]KQQ45715.1 sphingosine kinase [Duganella sp. Leaf126]
MLNSIVVIINASAGLGYCGDWSTTLAETFRRHGAEPDILLASSGAEMIERARRAVADKATVVVAGGGDGTINCVASQLVGSDTHLAVLALGTLNHFAKDLGIPLALDQAVANAVTGKPLRVDVGEVNGRIFLNNSSLGIYPDLVRDREQQQKKFGRSKWHAFGRALFVVLRRFPFMRVRLTVNGQEHLRRTPFVFIGNNEYLQGFTMGARERLDSGKLVMYVAQKPTRLALLRYAVHALFNRLSAARDFDVLTATELDIDTRHRHLRVATDGEVTDMKPPLHYRSRPGALSVIAPGRTTSTGS